MGAKVTNCPFCGQEAENRWRYRLPGEDAVYWVGCGSCGATTKAYGSEAEAVAAWNRRAGDAGVQGGGVA